MDASQALLERLPETHDVVIEPFPWEAPAEIAVVPTTDEYEGHPSGTEAPQDAEPQVESSSVRSEAEVLAAAVAEVRRVDFPALPRMPRYDQSYRAETIDERGAAY